MPDEICTIIFSLISSNIMNGTETVRTIDRVGLMPPQWMKSKAVLPS